MILNASPDFTACYVEGSYDPACADGYSTVMPLRIPVPQSRYVTATKTYRWLGQVTLRLTATQLGANRPYKACYRLKNGAKRCLRGTLNGYDWNSKASDDLTVRTRNLAKTTTFTWYVGGKKVGKRTIR